MGVAATINVAKDFIFDVQIDGVTGDVKLIATPQGGGDAIVLVTVADESGLIEVQDLDGTIFTG